MNSHIEPLELQRLLDGRLNSAERQAFLDCLEDDVDKWKTVALAFVEERLLQSELRRVIGAGESPATPPRRRKSDVWARGLTYAAVLAFSLVIGVVLGASSLFNSDAEPDTKAITQRPQPKQTQRRGDYYVIFPPGPKQETEQDPFDSMMTPVLDEGLRERVQGHGYRVKEEPVIYVLTDKQGRQYLIPQRQVSFEPENR